MTHLLGMRVTECRNGNAPLTDRAGNRYSDVPGNRQFLRLWCKFWRRHQPIRWSDGLDIWDVQPHQRDEARKALRDLRSWYPRLDPAIAPHATGQNPVPRHLPMEPASSSNPTAFDASSISITPDHRGARP